MNTPEQNTLPDLTKFYYETIVTQETTSEGIWYIASHPQLTGCTAMGKTWQEAIKNLKESRTSYLQAYIDNGWEIPKPVLSMLNNKNCYSEQMQLLPFTSIAKTIQINESIGVAAKSITDIKYLIV